MLPLTSTFIASAAKQSRLVVSRGDAEKHRTAARSGNIRLDCFVAALLARAEGPVFALARG